MNVKKIAGIHIVRNVYRNYPNFNEKDVEPSNLIFGQLGECYKKEAGIVNDSSIKLTLPYDTITRIEKDGGTNIFNRLEGNKGSFVVKQI